MIYRYTSDHAINGVVKCSSELCILTLQIILEGKAPNSVAKISTIIEELSEYVLNVQGCNELNIESVKATLMGAWYSERFKQRLANILAAKFYGEKFPTSKSFKIHNTLKDDDSKTEMVILFDITTDNIFHYWDSYSITDIYLGRILKIFQEV